MEGIHAPAKVQASTNEEVREKIVIQSREKFDQEPKPLQVDLEAKTLDSRRSGGARWQVMGTSATYQKV
jgi:hypothetical protein